MQPRDHLYVASRSSEQSSSADELLGLPSNDLEQLTYEAIQAIEPSQASRAPQYGHGAVGVTLRQESAPLVNHALVAERLSEDHDYIQGLYIIGQNLQTVREDMINPSIDTTAGQSNSSNLVDLATYRTPQLDGETSKKVA